MKPSGYMDEVGALVRQRRKALRVDQQTVADLAGVSRKLVSDIERGKPTVRMDGLLAVLAAIGLTLEVVDVR
ncbi:MAG: type II toxin-antitoxin system Y4mF family antitoxin [Actinomycetota bacterium]|nr:type II toxin-antitoxin system Y4mF family antitoxin [Actinomycetota bacterium]